MRTTNKYGPMTWINLLEPTQNEVRDVIDELGLHMETGEELLRDRSRPKAIFNGHYVFVTLHFPSEHHTKNSSRHIYEIDFVITKDVILTSHSKPIDVFYEFKSTLETQMILHKEKFSEITGGDLFIYILERLYREISDELDEMNDSLERIEIKIYENQEERMIKILAEKNRDLLAYKRSLSFHKHVLSTLTKTPDHIVVHTCHDKLMGLYEIFNMLEEQRQVNKQILAEIQETAQLLLSTRSNKTMSIITVVAFMAVPITIFTEFMSLELDIPFLEDDRAILGVFIMIVASGILLLLYLNKRKWL